MIYDAKRTPDRIWCARAHTEAYSIEIPIQIFLIARQHPIDSFALIYGTIFFHFVHSEQRWIEKKYFEVLCGNRTRIFRTVHAVCRQN